MKKISYLLLLTVVLYIKATAQPTQTILERHVYPGTITTTDGEVIKGYVFNDNRVQNQKKCIFYTDLDDERTRKVYKPADLAAYTIENIQYKSLSYSGNIAFGKPDRNFLRLNQPGYIATYVYYPDGKEQILWQKGDEPPVSDASMLFGFKKAVLKLVSDDADLAAKVEAKEKGYSNVLNLQAIIDEYNAWYAAKK